MAGRALLRCDLADLLLLDPVAPWAGLHAVHLIRVVDKLCTAIGRALLDAALDTRILGMELLLPDWAHDHAEIIDDFVVLVLAFEALHGVGGGGEGAEFAGFVASAELVALDHGASWALLNALEPKDVPRWVLALDALLAAAGLA